MARELASNAATQAKVQQIVTRKGVIVSVLGIDGVATRADLNNWINSSKVALTTVRDPDGKYPQSKAVLMTREWYFTVDLKTMKIVHKEFGDQGGGQQSVTALNSSLDDLIARLK